MVKGDKNQWTNTYLLDMIIDMQNYITKYSVIIPKKKIEIWIFIFYVKWIWFFIFFKNEYQREKKCEKNEQYTYKNRSND